MRENQELYAEQRTIAQTLQQALLPAELPQLAGTEASALLRARRGREWRSAATGTTSSRSTTTAS